MSEFEIWVKENEGLRTLSIDWDQQGAKAVIPEYCDNAIKLIEKLQQYPLPQISPNPDGSISLYWSSELLEHGSVLANFENDGFSWSINTFQDEYKSGTEEEEFLTIFKSFFEKNV